LTISGNRLYAHDIVLNTVEMLNGPLHNAGPLLARGRLVTVDGHPVCESCGSPVMPADAGRWEHVPEGSPFPSRSRWFSAITWTELRGMRSYRDFTRRYPWTVRRELCGGDITTEEDWAEGTRRLRDYHGQLTAARRQRRIHPRENPYLELVQVLAGGARVSWESVPGGLRTVLDLPARRRELAAVFSCAIPDKAALATVARHGPLLECGAGTGYWAALLADGGCDVLASDASPSSGAENGSGSPVGGPVAPGGHRAWTEVLALDAVSAVRAHPDRALFLCWPPPDDDSASYAALRAYRGDVLAYAGDAPGTEGSGAAAGTVRFHRELALNWTPAGQAALPIWPGQHDRLVIYRRNRVRRPLAGRERCPECKKFLPMGSAGRCDRCFNRNPPAMALLVNGHRVEYPQVVIDTMPPGLRKALERSPSLVWPPAGP
jgi:hypothetical protein